MATTYRSVSAPWQCNVAVTLLEGGNILGLTVPLLLRWQMDRSSSMSRTAPFCRSSRWGGHSWTTLYSWWMNWNPPQVESLCFNGTSLLHVPCFCAQIAVSHDGQIQYLPVRSEQQVVNTEDLKVAAHSAVTGWLTRGINHTCLVLYSVLYYINRDFIYHTHDYYYY